MVLSFIYNTFFKKCLEELLFIIFAFQSRRIISYSQRMMLENKDRERNKLTEIV